MQEKSIDTHKKTSKQWVAAAAVTVSAVMGNAPAVSAQTAGDTAAFEGILGTAPQAAELRSDTVSYASIVQTQSVPEASSLSESVALPGTITASQTTPAAETAPTTQSLPSTSALPAAPAYQPLPTTVPENEKNVSTVALSATQTFTNQTDIKTAVTAAAPKQQGFISDDKGNKRYFDPATGKQVFDQFVTDSGNTYYIGFDGQPAKGYLTLDDKLYYFDSKGIQAKGFRVQGSGKIRYYDPKTGAAVKNAFIEDDRGGRYYFDKHGVALTGRQLIDGQIYEFDSQGRLITADSHSQAAASNEGTEGLLATGPKARPEAEKNLPSHTDKAQTENIRTTLATAPQAKKEMAALSKPAQTSRTSIGHQQATASLSVTSLVAVQANSAPDFPPLRPAASSGQELGHRYLTLPQSYRYAENRTSWRFFNQFVMIKGKTYYFDAYGRAVTGSRTIEGKKYFFNKDGEMVKGELVRDEDNILRYYDEETGELVTDRTVTPTKGEYKGRTATIDKEGVAQLID